MIKPVSKQTMKVANKKTTLVILLVLLLAGSIVRAERIKDIADIQGIRGNPLSGVGLVIGLAGTGDSTAPSRQMLTNIIRRSGIVLDRESFAGGSVAIVMVTAELGPFDRRDSRIDVKVSAVGDAKSLQNGILLATELRGLDDQVYAVAEGPISTSSIAATGKTASVAKNHQTIGMIPAGAIVEKEEIADFVENIAGRRYISLNLRNKDFSTAQRISEAVNQLYDNCAVAADAGTVRIRLPQQISRMQITAFVDEITKLRVKVDMPAVVVINERTGTIVVGENVGISAVAVSQGSLVIKIKESEYVSQPTAPFSDAGQTERVQDTSIGIAESEGYLIPVPNVVTVSDLAKALNAIGATPRDLIAIFNALKKAGALQAKLVIM